MGILWWLAQEFWPVIAGAVALLAGWLGLKGYGASKAAQGRAEQRQQQEIANATAIMDRSRTDDAVRRAGADAARERLRRDFGSKPVRRVD